MNLKTLCFSIPAATALFVGTATAELADIQLDINGRGEGTFDVFISVSPDDNRGLLAYSIPLTGAITSITHVSPAGTLVDNSGALAVLAPLAFNAPFPSRSPDGDPTLQATQELIDEPSFFIFGFGQEDGNLEDLDTGAFTPFGGLVQPEYEARLHIASGTWDAAFGPGVAPEVDTVATEFGLSLFRPDATTSEPIPNPGDGTAGSIVLTVDDLGDDLMVTRSILIPEPSAVAIFSLLTLSTGILTSTRRRA